MTNLRLMLKNKLSLLDKMNHSDFLRHLSIVREQAKDIVKDNYWYYVFTHYNTSLTHHYPLSIRSSFFGRGVFADTDIPKGTVVTMYPAHHYGVKKEDSDDIFTVTYNAGLGKPDRDYALRINGGKTIIYGEPSTTQHQWFLGHMLNDVADLTKFRRGREAQWLADYRIRAVKQANCRYVIDNDYAYLLTLRDVKANEELFTVYGEDYWFHRLGCPNYKERIEKYLRSLPSHKKGFFTALLNLEPTDADESALPPRP